MILTNLYIYPIKSARGIAVTDAEVSSRGLLHDRRWLVANPAGEFLTQRELPRMALIDVRIQKGDLAMRAPGMEELTVPLTSAGGPRRRARIWQDDCDAVSAGEEAGRWFTRFLGTPCELLHMPDDSLRPMNASLPGDPQGGALFGFADTAPFLLISEASFSDLCARLATPLPMNRFRPNLVVSGCEAFAEDGWSEITIGDIGFWVVKPCSRCVIITIDQETAVKGVEPLVTLAGYRKRRSHVMFGQLLVQKALGSIRKGDPVQVVR